MDLIDIEAERKKKNARDRKKRKAENGPDHDCMTTGPDGKTYYKFSVRYQYQNKNWTFELWATSKKDAEKRLCNIQNFPIEIAQIYAQIPQ